MRLIALGGCTIVVAAAFTCLAVQGAEPKPKPDPAPPTRTDDFAGKTVKDRATGLKLIDARRKNVPKVGEMAPDFELKTSDGKRSVKLSSFRGKQPVVLIFGSFT